MMESATQNSGLFLFDSPNYVGEWEGVTGYRGMLDAWRHEKLNQEIQIEIVEGQSDQGEPEESMYEVYVYCPAWDHDLQEKHRKQGKDEWYDKLMEDNYEECLKVEHEYMEKNK